MCATAIAAVLGTGWLKDEAVTVLRGDEFTSRASRCDEGTEAPDTEELEGASSSQTNMVYILWVRIMEGCCEKHQALLDT
jgi:hypothetical protein